MKIDDMAQQIDQNLPSNNLQELQSKKNKYCYQREIVYSLINYIEKVDGNLESELTRQNRPGPIKRLKPSLPNENSSPSSSSTAAAIATIKKYPPPVRRPLLTTNQTPTRSTQSKQSTPIKQRSSPITSDNSSSKSFNYRTPIGGISRKIVDSPSPKQIITNSSSSRPPVTNTCKSRLSIFGEQFSADILKTNLLWIDLKELDEESRSEVILQFVSIENKTIVNRSRFQFLLPKKDRLELL